MDLEKVQKFAIFRDIVIIKVDRVKNVLLAVSQSGSLR